jgi:SAM-dependent methyltransferase
MNVIWHDLECGRYEADLPFWRALAAAWPGPILDVGAGTGRVALELARAGHDVTALDIDAELLAAMEQRAGSVSLATVTADARDFELEARFGLVLVPMQTIQLLGGVEGRAAFLSRARQHLRPGGRLAIAIADQLEEFEVVAGGPAPLPDVCELEGTVYSSAPTAVRSDGDGFTLERRRETVTATGELMLAEDRIHIDALDPGRLEQEGQSVGLRVAPRQQIAPTQDYVGSVVVMFDA